jgi:Kinesin motor domain
VLSQEGVQPCHLRRCDTAASAVHKAVAWYAPERACATATSKSFFLEATQTCSLAVQEIEKKEENIVTVVPEEGEVLVDEAKTKVDLMKFTERHKFVFDDSLDHNVDNDTVYSFTVQPLVATIFRSGKATCFAYGQTGSGKTYTMSPLPPRAAAEILHLLDTRHGDLSLYVSCFEIYGNKARAAAATLLTTPCVHKRCLRTLRDASEQGACDKPVLHLRITALQAILNC